MTPAALAYLQTRLRGILCEQCDHAAGLITGALVLSGGAGLTTTQERDLCHLIWDAVSRALDSADLSPEQYLVLDAIESEMAGRVLSARLALGELVKCKQPSNHAHAQDTGFLAHMGQMTMLGVPLPFVLGALMISAAAILIAA